MSSLDSSSTVKRKRKEEKETDVRSERQQPEGSGNRNLSIFEQPSKLGVHLRPWLEACSLMGRGETEGAFQLTRSIISPSAGVVKRQRADRALCGSEQLEGIVQTVLTALKEMRRQSGHDERTGDSSEAVKCRTMDAMQLQQCLSCNICSRRMRNPYTSCACLHSFCRDCIDEELSKQGDEKRCPVAGCVVTDSAGIRPTPLGSEPFSSDNLTVVKDLTLSHLIRKLFNGGKDSENGKPPKERQIVTDLELGSTGAEDKGLLRCIQVKCTTTNMTEDVTPLTRLEGLKHEEEEETEYMTVAVFPMEGDATLFSFDDNYFYVPSCLTVREFHRYLENRFKLTDLRLFCNESRISNVSFSDMTLMEVGDEFWIPYNEYSDEILTLHYSHQPLPSETKTS